MMTLKQATIRSQTQRKAKANKVPCKATAQAVSCKEGDNAKLLVHETASRVEMTNFLDYWELDGEVDELHWWGAIMTTPGNKKIACTSCTWPDDDKTGKLDAMTTKSVST